MFTQEQITEAVHSWLIHNHSFLKMYLKDILESRERLLKENPEFADEINAEFETLIRREISTKAEESLGVGAEFVMIAVECLNLENFLKA